MPLRPRPHNRRSIEKSDKLYERPCHVDKNDDTTRFMRREWKHNKPAGFLSPSSFPSLTSLRSQHLQRSDSLPTLSVLPSTRPHFTCRQCHFTNTVIPMCLWCCWTSKESEALFEKSMPRARRMSAPMRISSAVETPRKRWITEENSGSFQKGKVTDGVRIQRVDTRDPTKDGVSNPVISLNRFLPRRGYRKETPNGSSHDISDRRGSAADTRTELVSRKRGASCSRTSGAAGIEGRLGPRRSGVVGEREMVVQKGVGQKMKYPTKAKSCADISQPSKLGGSIALAEDNSVIVPTPSESAINGRPLLPLRLRRLKQVATPLQIDSQAKIPMTHAAYSTSSPHQSHTTMKTTRKSPLSPKIFRRVHELSISHSPSKWPRCISDAEMSDVEDDRSITIASAPSRSDLTVQLTAPEREGMLPMSRNTMTKTTPGQFYSARSIIPPIPRSPWSKSDPFGELLGLGTDTMTNPTFSLPTVSSTIPTPITPDIPERADLTRHRATTVSGYDQSTAFNQNPYNRYPITPTSPNSSVYSFSGHPQKPLYASIRKDGMYLSPLSSPRLPTSPSKPSINPTPVDRATCDPNNLGKGNNVERLSPSSFPSLYPCSPQPSPLSPVFTPYINPAGYDDGNLSSLSLESRSSSTEGSCGGDGIFVDAFELSTMKGGYGGAHKSGLMARWTKPQHKFDGNIQSKVRTRMGRTSREKSIGKEDVGTGPMRMPPSTSNPALMNQRLFRVPFALGGASGFGCSMSGETELKLALRARAMCEDGVNPPGQDGLANKAKLHQGDEATMGEKSLFSQEDRHAIESQMKPSVSPLVRRLRAMVSTGFLRHGDGE